MAHKKGAASTKNGRDSNAQRLGVKRYGGQQVNKTYAEMANSVDKSWQWPPIQEYVATQGDDIKGKSVDQGKGATAALQPWQDSVVNYAKQQGLTVAGQ